MAKWRVKHVHGCGTDYYTLDDCPAPLVPRIHVVDDIPYRADDPRIVDWLDDYDTYHAPRSLDHWEDLIPDPIYAPTRVPIAEMSHDEVLKELAEIDARRAN